MRVFSRPFILHIALNFSARAWTCGQNLFFLCSSLVNTRSNRQYRCEEVPWISYFEKVATLPIYQLTTSDGECSKSYPLITGKSVEETDRRQVSKSLKLILHKLFISIPCDGFRDEMILECYPVLDKRILDELMGHLLKHPPAIVLSPRMG